VFLADAPGPVMIKTIPLTPSCGGDLPKELFLRHARILLLSGSKSQMSCRTYRKHRAGGFADDFVGYARA